DFVKVQTDAIPGASGSFSYTPSQGQGYYRFYTIAVDKAGNREAAPATADTITQTNLDSTAPVTTDNADSNWHNADVTVTLSPTDGPSGTASGVDKTFYKVDAGSYVE